MANELVGTCRICQRSITPSGAMPDNPFRCCDLDACRVHQWARHMHQPAQSGGSVPLSQALMDELALGYNRPIIGETVTLKLKPRQTGPNRWPPDWVGW